MNIVFLENVQNYGGARKSTIELASRLSEKHNVIIYDLYGTCLPFIKACEKERVTLQILQKRTQPLILSQTSLVQKIKKHILFLSHILFLGFALKRIAKDSKVDYFIVNNNKVLSLLWGVKKYSKVIYFARGWFLPKQIPIKGRILMKRIVNRFICVSEATKQALYAGRVAELENIYVVHNAISFKKGVVINNNLFFDSKKKKFTILQAAGFLPTKGIHIAIEIAYILKQKEFPFQMIIAGLIYKGSESAQYYQTIKKMIKDYNLEKEVSLIVNKSDILELFEESDVLIHPSATEGLPRVVMEAMFFKKPVIANAVGGVTDFILNEFTGFLPHTNSVKEYCKIIMQLSKNQKVYEEISRNAYSLIKKTFTEEKQISSFINALEF